MTVMGTIKRFINRMLNYYFLVSQVFVLISGVLSLIDGYSYYRCLYAATAMHFVAVIQNNGVCYH